MPKAFEKLVQIFMSFPGIGPRQAKRFVYFLLGQPKGFRKEIANVIETLGDDIAQCQACFRYFSGKSRKCDLCLNPNINNNILMVVEKDIDLENIKRAGTYDGAYFVLGGLLPILEKDPQSKIRLRELKSAIAGNKGLKEVILALSANPVGDNTVDFIRETLGPLAKENGFLIS